MNDLSSPADAKLNDVIVAYLEAAEAGWAPPAEQVLTAYPDLRAELTEFFRNRESVERIAAPLRDVARAAAEMPVDAPLGRLGDFQLLREVGRGGMGVVYEAEQISLRRRVALKVLPFAAAIDARHLQRFRTEALAAAHLQHENIVPVYAVGTERGVHYYAMRFIDGQSLAAVVTARRGPEVVSPDDATGPYLANAELSTAPDAPVPASGSVGRELSARQYPQWVADIGRQAALALEHAHQSGIVHRDIKPANLLLDSVGKLWVADFGLAQVSTADVGLTLTGEILGTLRYASPEQALAKPGLIDHRSDVYSLGATLYELLTLHLMFAGVTRLALLRQIAESEPIPLRQLDRAIPAELETIVLKAVAKEPPDRYPTAAAFADDLQRFLDDRPILARRPTTAEKAVKWLRRHPAYTAVGVLVLVLVTVGFGIATALISREKNRTESAMLREKERANEAERRFDLARNAADDMIRFADEELGHGPPQDAARRRLLETALAYYQQFIDLRKDDPTAAAALEATRARVSGVLADLAVMQGANRHLLLRRPDVQDELGLTDAQRERARELFDRILGPRGGPGPGYVRMTGDQRSRKLVAEIKAHEAEVTAILSPDQLKRLRQIALQFRGPFAFQDADVIAALKLTTAQREKMRALEAEGFGRRPGPPPEFGGPGGPGGRGFGGGRGRGGPPFDGFPQKWLDVLTADQQATWQRMVGPPFHAKKR